MTRMYGCDSTDKGGLKEQGYAQASPTFSIGQALYYFSHLAEETPDCPEHWLAGLQVTIQKSGNGIPEEVSDPPAGPWFWFEPWKYGTQLGPKNWIGTTCNANGESKRVMFKLWDAWYHPKETPMNASELARDNEVTMYKELHTLWGVCVPHLLAHGTVHFCHGLIIDFIEDVLSFINCV